MNLVKVDSFVRRAAVAKMGDPLKTALEMAKEAERRPSFLRP